MRTEEKLTIITEEDFIGNGIPKKYKKKVGEQGQLEPPENKIAVLKG